MEFDPLSEEAMRDPRPIYARLRREDPVHYMKAYDSWALSRFADVWPVCGDTANFTCTKGMHPQTILFGEPPGESADVSTTNSGGSRDSGVGARATSPPRWR